MFTTITQIRRLEKYWMIFKIQIQNNLAYPAELVWRSLAILLFLWVFTQLWRVAYGTTANGELAGLTLNQMLWYLMLAEAIELSRPRFARMIADSVKDGSIAYLLNKPYNFLLYQMGVNAGDSVLRLGLNLIFGSALIWFMAGPPPDPRGYPFVLVAIALGWLINFCITCLIGLAAFLSEEVAPYEWIYQKFIFILGGMMIPLDLYPIWLQNIAKALPFAYLMYGPSKLFVAPSFEFFLRLVAAQAAWIIALGIIVVLAYRSGIRRLSINGG
jgi:viologen exporter family transport system permease protein